MSEQTLPIEVPEPRRDIEAVEAVKPDDGSGAGCGQAGGSIETSGEGAAGRGAWSRGGVGARL